jgi:hypothetical protein
MCDRDQRDHDGEAAVNGVDEIRRRSRLAPDPDVRTERMRCFPNRRQHGLASLGAAVRNRNGFHNRGTAPTPAGPIRRDGAVDAIDRSQPLRHCFRVRVALGQDLVRKEGALSDACILKRDQTGLAVA